MFWSLLIKLRCLAPVAAQGRGIAQDDVWLLDLGTKTTRKEGQHGHFFMFLGLSSPRPASGSPRPWNAFILKQSACLGELIPSSWSNQLAWASFPYTKWPFPINSHAGEGFQGLAIEGTEGKMQGEREEEKSKAEVLQNQTVDRFLHPFSC